MEESSSARVRNPLAPVKEIANNTADDALALQNFDTPTVLLVSVQLS